MQSADEPQPLKDHPLRQSPRSFWPVAGIERSALSSALVQHRKSAIHGLPVNLANLIGWKYETNSLRILKKLGLARALEPCHRPEGSLALGRGGGWYSKPFPVALTHAWCIRNLLGPIPFPRYCAPFDQHQESQPQWRIGSDLSDLTLSMCTVTESMWIADFRGGPSQVAVLGADQKERGNERPNHFLSSVLPSRMEKNQAIFPESFFCDTLLILKAS